MSRPGMVLTTCCLIALTAALMPALASGASVTSPDAAAAGIDERKKPKPTKAPRPTKSVKPSKSPRPTPSLTDLTAPVPLQARAIEQWIESQPKTYQAAQSTFAYTVQPTLVGSDWETASTAGAKAAFEVHTLLGQPVQDTYRVYLGWDFEWLRQAISTSDCPRFYDNQDAGACPPSDVIFTRFSGNQRWDPDVAPDSKLRTGVKMSISGLLGHELTHMVQESLYPRRSATVPYPKDSRWLLEGWASMVQMLVLMRVYDLPYSQARDFQLKLLTTPCLGVKLRDLLVEPTGNGCEYIRGLLAYEYLMWKTGDMQAGWTWSSQDAATAREAFEMAFPLDIDDFMEEADVYVDRELALWPLRQWPN